METVFHTLSNRYDPNPSESNKWNYLYSYFFGRVKYTSLLGFDPLLKGFNGEKSSNKIVVKNQLSLGYRSEYSTWVGPFIMADVMSNCVRRSNVLNNYSSKLTYKYVYRSCFSCCFMADVLLFFVLVKLLFIPILPQVSFSFLD
jgi:hypothetical protein